MGKALVIVVIVFASSLLACVSSTCVEPANPQLELASALYEMYTDPLYANFSLNIAPCQGNNVPAYPISNDDSPIPGTCPFNLNNEGCIAESMFLPMNGYSTTDRTKCSWRYELDINENRVPRTIAKARCKCIHCHRGVCEYIYSYLPVVVKECNAPNGLYVYRKSIQRIPVGCACVKNMPSGVFPTGTARRVMFE